MGKESSDRIELLQGTLDMLILRPLLFGPAHGHHIAKQSNERRRPSCKSSTVRPIPPCTGWSGRAGCQRSGSWQRTATATSSLPADASRKEAARYRGVEVAETER
jgi:hypothetical protein